MNRIRAVLNGNAAKPRFIETVVGKGYRFIADVEEVEAGRPPISTQSGSPQTHSLASVEEISLAPREPLGALPPAVLPTCRRPGWRFFWSLQIAAVLAAGTMIWWRAQVREDAHKATFKQITTNDSENRVTAVAISPGGRLLVFADQEGISLRVIRSGATQSIPAPPGIHAERLAWFPDELHVLISGIESKTLQP